MQTHTRLALPAAQANYEASQTSNPPSLQSSSSVFFMHLMILLFGDAAGSPRLLLMPLHLLPPPLLTAGGKMSQAIIYYWQSIQELGWISLIPVQTRTGGTCLTTGNYKWGTTKCWNETLCAKIWVHNMWRCVDILYVYYFDKDFWVSTLISCPTSLSKERPKYVYSVLLAAIHM